MSKLRLVRFHWNCGRMGSLEGQFVLDAAGWKKLQALVGSRIYFGEVLGKHSEIEGTLDADDIWVVTDDQAFLNRAHDLDIDLDTGFNPLDYAGDEDEVEES